MKEELDGEESNETSLVDLIQSIKRLVRKLSKKESIEAYLNKIGLTFDEMFEYCDKAPSEVFHARRMAFLVNFLRVKGSKFGYADWEFGIKKSFEAKLEEIAEKLESKMEKFVARFPAKERENLSAFIKKIRRGYYIEELISDGIFDLPKVLDFHDFIMEYTEPISNKFYKSIEMALERNKANNLRNKPPEYDAFGYYLEPIFAYASECKNTTDIIAYFKWVILQSRRSEFFNEYYDEPFDSLTAKRMKSLREMLEIEIDLMEMGQPWDGIIFNREGNFNPQGYGKPLDMSALLRKIPVSERKMYRFISSESRKQTPLIQKITSGKYSIRNNCESKIRAALNY